MAGKSQVQRAMATPAATIGTPVANSDAQSSAQAALRAKRANRALGGHMLYGNSTFGRGTTGVI